jgi:hypothetical protein
LAGEHSFKIEESRQHKRKKVRKKETTTNKSPAGKLQENPEQMRERAWQELLQDSESRKQDWRMPQRALG